MNVISCSQLDILLMLVHDLHEVNGFMQQSCYLYYYGNTKCMMHNCIHLLWISNFDMYNSPIHLSVESFKELLGLVTLNPAPNTSDGMVFHHLGGFGDFLASCGAY